MQEICVIRKTSERFLSAIKITKMAKCILGRLAISQGLSRLAQKKMSSKSALTIVLVDVVEGQQLNKRHRRKNYATDVLSFSPVENESLGELVFCVSVVKRQAREHKLTYENEFCYMLIHGLLHLLGYDHEKSPRQAARMYSIQDKIFEGKNGFSDRTVRRKK